jgi:hypothetical protein
MARAIRNLILNRQSSTQSAVRNPILTRQSPIANSIGSLQSAVGSR